MDISGLCQTLFNQLSQGQRQMILIARAMVKNPKLLILDEPCAGLDPENRNAVLSLLELIGQSGSQVGVAGRATPRSDEQAAREFL